MDFQHSKKSVFVYFAVLNDNKCIEKNKTLKAPKHTLQKHADAHTVTISVLKGARYSPKCFFSVGHVLVEYVSGHMLSCVRMISYELGEHEMLPC